MGVSVLGAGHPLVAHLVSACAVEVQPGGLLRLCLGGIKSGNAAGAGSWSSTRGSAQQQVGADHGCCPDGPWTMEERHGMGASADDLLDTHPNECLQQLMPAGDSFAGVAPTGAA